MGTRSRTSTYLTALFAVNLALLLFACQVPQSYAKRQGWKTVETTSSVSAYELSLNSEYIQNGHDDPRNRWRVLNYMMYFLAKGVSQNEINTGRGGQIAQYLDELRPLNARTDSARVMIIYSKVFMGEDSSWSSSTSGNTFICDELVKRADQVLRYGGFDPFGRLNEWGKLITRLGPLDLEDFGDEDGATYYVGVFRDGLRYKAMEGSFDFRIVKVSRNLITPGPNLNESDAQDHQADILQPGPERTNLATSHAHELYVPASNRILAVRMIEITPLPCPLSTPWHGFDAAYLANPWTARRFVIGLYGNIRDFDVVDSAGSVLLQFDLEYTVRSGPYTESNEDQPVCLLSGKEAFRYDVTKTGHNDGFVARVCTDPIVATGSVVVGIRVTNGGKSVIEKKMVELEDRSFPLVIIDPSAHSTSSAMARLAVGPVRKSDTVHILSSIDGLVRNPGEEHYSGIAYVLCLDAKSRNGIVKVGDSLEVTFDDSLAQSEDSPANPWHSRSRDGVTCIDTLQIESDYPRGIVDRRIRIPDYVKRGTTRMLALDFYAFDHVKGQTKHLGTASTLVQVE